MWLDEYNELNNGERERFAKLVNYLLNKTYLTREIYEGTQVIGKINADYRFVERYITLFEGYLNVINYKLTIDEELGVVYLSNDYGYNKMHLDKLTTLILFTLRTIYDEEKEKYLDIKDFNIDILFYQQPWGISSVQGVEKVYESVLCCYYAYGISVLETPIEVRPFHEKLFKYFIPNKETESYLKKFEINKLENLNIVGYPKLDIYNILTKKDILCYH